MILQEDVWKDRPEFFATLHYSHFFVEKYKIKNNFSFNLFIKVNFLKNEWYLVLIDFVERCFDGRTRIGDYSFWQWLRKNYHKNLWMKDNKILKRRSNEQCVPMIWTSTTCLYLVKFCWTWLYLFKLGYAWF